jgi:hypothetical protein
MSTVGASGSNLPTADYVASPSIAMAGGAGRVALVNGVTALVGCPAAGSYIDLVGYGTGTVCYEGPTGPTGTLSTTLAAFRNNNGCTDTNNNASDFTTATPAPRNSASPTNICGGGTITTSALTAFGNVCINTTAGPNSFTITGTALTIANVTVGALPGFTYSTTAAGTYTNTLSLAQPGGSYSQQIFVKFTPTAVQSYNGIIPVGGGGSSSSNVAASGAGINIIVTTGAASAITNTSATLAGTANTTCAAITAYGIEYSLVNNFPIGSGTPVPSSNISGGNFSSAVSGLSQGLTYYYRAYATNAAGTVYGAQQSFLTTGTMPVLTATPLTALGSICINTTGGPDSFIINSGDVTAANITVGPLAGFLFSTTATGTYTASLSLVHPAGPYTQTVYVLFNPALVQSYNGNIPVAGGGAATINVAVTGSAVNTAGSSLTGSAVINNPNSVTLNGSVSSTGCSPVTSYGIEYSGISGLANGLGTKVPSVNLSGGNYSVTLNGLVQGATYYYKTYVVNSGGITYGVEQSFTMTGIPGGFIIYDNPIRRGTNMHYSYKGIKPGHYQIQVFNSVGQLVFQRELITQLDFIDDNFIVPGKLGTGVYSLHIVSPDFRDKKRFMIW